MTYDVLVVGAGSAGCGAAIAAARLGCSVLLLEKSDRIGGNAVRCGVSNWEPGVGAVGLPFEIYRRLKRLRSAVGIYSFGRHCLWDGFEVFPGGEHRIDPKRSYVDTLRRYGIGSLLENPGLAKENLHGVSFEPDAYEQTLRSMIDETSMCNVRLESSITRVYRRSERIDGIDLTDGTRIGARFFVDASGDANLCAEAGCDVVVGQESRETYDEPSAPEKANNRINGVTLVYRISRKRKSGIDDGNDLSAQSCWWRDAFPAASIVEYPNGDRSVNMLPTMEGREFLDGPYDEAYRECFARVKAHWRFLQDNYAEFRGFAFHSCADAIGVRESLRVVGEYVLTEHDIRSPVAPAERDDSIAIADHAFDRHGEKGGAKELDAPFSIPYRCLIQKGESNLLIACRAASFSSIAASSCRLSRTMLQLGHAAVTACALAKRNRLDLPGIDPYELRSALRLQGVQLSHPMEPELRRFVEDDTPW